MGTESQYATTNMKYQFWKRKIFPVWYQQHNSWEDSNMIQPFSALKSENLSINESTPDTTVSKQNFIDGKEILYTTTIVIVILITIVIIGVLLFVRRRNYKHHDEEQSCSILVYPSQQGSSVPQLLTKDINFSLPPLRSTSLGDLNETEYNDDSDYDTDTLLLPSNHNQRSHSFSCYGLGVIEPALYKGNLNLEELQWPEGHIGRLWFSLRYEPSTEKLLVSLLKAKNLPSRTIGTVNSCDPFIRLHLLPDERRYLQSKQKKKTCNPYFDETLVFQVSIKDMSDHILKLTVVDGGRTKRKSEIGHVTFPLKNLEVGDGTEQQLFKFDLEKKLHELKSDLGEILISLVYNEHLNRLTATVIEARRLKVKQQTNIRNGVYKNCAEVVTTTRNAFKSGKTKSLSFRKEQLKKLMQLLEDNVPEFEKSLYSDLGRHKQESALFDIEYSIFDIKKTIQNLSQWCALEKPEKPLVNALDSVYIYNDPYGVVLVIGAWNFPINLVFVPVAGAIAAGNCVIIKPSEMAPATAKLIAELIPKYLDKECYHVYTGGVPETTQLLEQRFDYIFFTGSTAVGKIIHAAANKYLTPVTLELGGKSPVYVDDTVNIEITARRILWGKCTNAGQICIAPDYLLCTKDVQKDFIAAAAKILNEWYGTNVKDSPCYSRLISDKHYDRLVNFLKDKTNIAIGGKTDANQRFIEPTILVDVNPNDPVMQEEIFGPILPIITIDNPYQAISFINAREKPLALYVFTNDKGTKDLFLNNTSSGGVAINDTIMHFSVDSIPFGGVGFSGMGGYHGKYSFDTFTHKKGILERNLQKLPEKASSIRYPPYSETKTKIAHVLLKPIGVNISVHESSSEEELSSNEDVSVTAQSKPHNSSSDDDEEPPITKRKKKSPKSYYGKNKFKWSADALNQNFQGDKHEAYVRITLNQHYRGIKEKRTSVAKPSIDGNHSFAEGFNFKLIPSQADITSLAFHVFQHTTGYGRDKLIGKCVLGSYMFARGRALTHWNTAVANPMEPLQQWHTLNE
ncbi:hypothetical protein RN001_014114 [Aquatica leii]|uniref:C2 domain-containing protein n=1 Tax=Aquatica leii TaxID=1421715 RepID=A0AAN7SEC5_9COLE|nr:hypothetical protein RN001_014114 [Aquatica leii]